MGKGELDAAFANVAFSMSEPNKVSKIVQSEFGYHIIQFIDKRGDKVKCRHILKHPHIAQADIDTAMVHLDSIAEDIRQEKISFENAVLYASDDKDTRNNHGILTNRKEITDERTTRFEMGELSALSPELARVVDGMEVGDISKPFEMVNSKGMKVCCFER
jgi:peptidyl-prolyl cis-trans isomerase SurA